MTNMMKLIEVPLGARVRLLDVHGRGLRGKLIQYGLHMGDCIRLLRAAPLGGPLLVESCSRDAVLTRTLRFDPVSGRRTVSAKRDLLWFH